VSRSQLHGKRFEDILKSAFPGASDHSRKATSLFDIEGTYDRENGLPTSIKTTCNDTICLASAVKFWKTTNSQRWLIGRYRQTPATKQFHELLEFILTEDMLKSMRGDVTLCEISDYDASLRRFAVGMHVECRQWAQASKSTLASRLGAVMLNPKIDSRHQRRLQCSITVPRLSALCAPVSYTEYYRDVGIQCKLRSSSREFR
jgi:hypothetical protein